MLPDVATIAEQGYPGFDAGTWYGILVPANTPPDVVKKLNEVGNAALKSPAIVAKIVAEGGVVLGGSGADFSASFRADRRRVVEAHQGRAASASTDDARPPRWQWSSVSATQGRADCSRIASMTWAL